MSRFRFIRGGLLVAGLAIAATSACREDTSGARQPPKGVIVVVGTGRDDPKWPWLSAAATSAGESLGSFNLAVHADAPKRSTANDQVELIRRLSQEGIQALCVQVSDPDALSLPLKQVAVTGVRVVTMMSPISSEEAYMHVGHDEQLIGHKIADALAEAVEGEGQIAVLHADVLGRPWTRRHLAFKNRLEAYSGIEAILALDCGGDPSAAERIIRDTTARYPRLAGWAVMGSWPLRSHADPAALVPPRCRLIAADPAPDCRARILDGSVHALVVPRYDRMVELAVTACAKAIVGASRAVDVRSVPIETVLAQDWAEFDRRMKASGATQTEIPLNGRATDSHPE